LQGIKRISAVILTLLLAVSTAFGGERGTVEAAAKTAAAEKKLSLTKTAKTLYLGGCRGKKANGTKAKYYSLTNVAGMLSGYDPGTMSVKLSSADKSIASVSSKKARIYAKGIGETVVTLTVKDKISKKTLLGDEIRISVKKSATEDTLYVQGIEDGDEFCVGESVSIVLPNYQSTRGIIPTGQEKPVDYDTDLRRLVCEDPSVLIEPGKSENSFAVSFTEPGEFTLTAQAYQSKSFKGSTAEREFTVYAEEAEGITLQTGLCSFSITGDVLLDAEPQDIGIYRCVDGVNYAYSNIKCIEYFDNGAEVTVFKPFEGGYEYLITVEDNEYRFTASGSSVEDVSCIELDISDVEVNTTVDIPVKYYNSQNMDITAAVASKLDSEVKLTMLQTGMMDAFLSGKSLYVITPDIKLLIEAQVVVPDGDSFRLLKAEAEISSHPIKQPEFTGESIYTFTADDAKYLKAEDKTVHYIPAGDNVVFEALLLYDDGKYRTLQEVGVTRLIIADPLIAMQRGNLFSGRSGGTALTINNQGKTRIIAMKGDIPLATFDLEVTEARKPAAIKTELSKTKLNTDFIVGDYLIVKADLLDNYGDRIEFAPFTIEQKEENIRANGAAMFSSFMDGRLIINGWDCDGIAGDGNVEALIKSGELSAEISFEAKNVSWDFQNIDEVDYRLKVDGPSLINTNVGMKNDPTMVFMTVELTKDGFLIGEFGGELLEEEPTMNKTASQYHVAPGEGFFAFLVKHTPYGSEKAEILKENECVFAAYDGLELDAFTYGSRIADGAYEVYLYYITGGTPFSLIDFRGEEAKTVIRAYDGGPDIEISQIAESAVIDSAAPWTQNIKKYFKFCLGGEDITDYVTKVDCRESGTGAVFVNSVEISYRNPVYGNVKRSCDIGILIARQ